MNNSEISLLHNIDMEYLINPEQQKRINDKNKKNSVNNTETKFYRKRLIQLTKDLLSGSVSNSNLESVFDCYVKEGIKYLKFVDKKDIIQDEYLEVTKEMNNKKEERIKKIREHDNNKTNETIQNDTEATHLGAQNPDELLMNKTELKPSIENFVKVKRNVKQEREIMPKERDINLKDPKLKKKGIKKKKKNLEMK